MGTNALSICLDKIFFVWENIEIVQDKSFVQGQILFFHWCQKKLRRIDLILPWASAKGKITNVAGAEGGG